MPPIPRNTYMVNLRQPLNRGGTTQQSVAAVGNTILGNTLNELTNTSGGALTMTSTPTIPDGRDGDQILLLNVGTQNIVLQDQGTLPNSNLRLTAASVTLGPRASMRLIFSRAVGDWIEIAFLQPL